MYRSGNSNPTLADLQFEQALEDWNRVKKMLIMRLKRKYGSERIEQWLKK